MIEISKMELTKLVSEGAKKNQIADKYNLTMAATGRLLKDAGLKIKKTHKPTYTLVDSKPSTEVVN